MMNMAPWTWTIVRYGKYGEPDLYVGRPTGPGPTVELFLPAGLTPNILTGDDAGAERARIRRELLEEFGCNAPPPEECLCGHGAGAHRSGGLCEACIPAGDHTGAESACQSFRLPIDPDAALKIRLRAALDRICSEPDKKKEIANG